METTEEENKKPYFGARIVASLFEYVGLISGISGGVSVLESGWTRQKAGLILVGGVVYALGKLYHSASDISIIEDEFERRGLEEKVFKP